MANELFSINWITAPFDDVMKDSARVTDRATLYALRATGRAMGRVAKSNAPVYKGDDPRAQAESGQLKKSIKNSRTVVHLGTGSYAMFMGPFGSKKKGTHVHRNSAGELRGVPLYRRQMESKYGYMAAAIAEGEATISATYGAALAKAYDKYR